MNTTIYYGLIFLLAECNQWRRSFGSTRGSTWDSPTDINHERWSGFLTIIKWTIIRIKQLTSKKWSIIGAFKKWSSVTVSSSRIQISPNFSGQSRHNCTHLIWKSGDFFYNAFTTIQLFHAQLRNFYLKQLWPSDGTWNKMLDSTCLHAFSRSHEQTINPQNPHIRRAIFARHNRWSASNMKASPK